MRSAIGAILLVLGCSPLAVFAAPTGGDDLDIDAGALDPSITRTLVTAHAAFPTTGDFTVHFRNAAKIPVSLLYQSNSGAPPPLGNIPTTGVVPPSVTTTVVFPTGWAGAVVVGDTYNPEGSRFEASFDEPANAPIPAYDVSYVNGYSTPIVCGCDGQLVTGCNLPLFKMNPCYHLSDDGAVCLNPARDLPNGPPTPFFAPCQGAVFTFPNDTNANTDCNSHTINCCFGPECNYDIKQKTH